jgi:hypothetical protein
MNISEFIMIILVLGGFFFIFGLMTQEAQDYYPEAGINDSEWYDKYDYVSDVNSSIYPLKESFDTISDENKGWFSKLTAGIAAIPAAVIAIPSLIFGSLSTGGSIISGTFTTLNIHPYFIVLVGVMILVWAVFKLIEVYNRWQV